MKNPWNGNRNAGNFFSALIGNKQRNTVDNQSIPEPEDVLLSSEEPSQEQSEREAKRHVLEFSPSSIFWQLWLEWRQNNPLSELQLSLSPPGAQHICPLTPSELDREKRLLTTQLESEAKLQLTQRKQLLAQQKKKSDESESDEALVDLPARCAIHIAQNQMAAWLLVFPPSGSGEGLSRSALEEVLKKADISVGIITTEIDRILEDNAYFQLCPIAYGTPAVQGDDGYIVEHFSREKLPQFKPDASGCVDYRAQSYIKNICAGDVLCDIVPPGPGEDGIHVRGGIIKANAGKAAKIPNGSNTALSEDGLHLVATMDGHVEYNSSVFQVKPSLEIPGDVDYSTGNIQFRGDVHIAGDVRKMFSVCATGTIVIDGLVEAACVQADGDIVIAKGVVGDQQAVIRSKKSVRAKFLENCIVYAGESVHADCIITSDVYSDGRISVLTGRGAAIGGNLVAAELVEAVTLGTKSERKTVVSLGSYPCARDEYRQIGLELEALHTEQDELEKTAPSLPDIQTDGAAKYRLRKSVLAMKEDKLLKQQEEIQEKIPDLKKCRMKCGTVYPGTQLIIGEERMMFDTLYQHCTAVYNHIEQKIDIL